MSSASSNEIKAPLRVSQRTVTGVCHPSNKRAIQWSHRSGLVAYASHGSVVILDTVTCQVVQTLDEHKCSVTRLAWTQTGCQSKHLSDRLTLATADVSGKILVWNVNSGEVKARLQDNPTNDNSLSQTSVASVLDLSWLDGRFENSGHLLLSLHWPNCLVLWDTAKGTKVWRYAVGNLQSQVFLGFDTDPFDAHRLVLRSGNGSATAAVFVNDFKLSKQPANVTSFQLGSNMTSSVNEAVAGKGGKSMQRMQKVRSKMLEFVTMNEQSSSGGNEGGGECIQTLFHSCARNHLLMVFPRQVIIIDLDIHQAVGVIAIDKSHPNIIQAVPCSQRDAIYLLHENGSVSLRVRKGVYNTCTAPVASLGGTRRSMSIMSLSGRSPTPASAVAAAGDTTPSDVGGQLVWATEDLEVVYEQRSLSEPIRLGKNGRVLGMAVNSITESTLAVWTSEGRVCLLEVQQEDDKKSAASDKSVRLDLQSLLQRESDDTTLKLHTGGVLTGLASPPFVIRMCPALTMKNLEEYVPRMAVGAANGNVQILDTATGRVDREFASHTFPVRGIEWTSLHTILSFAHQNLSSTNASVRNELIHTDIRTGAGQSLRSHRTEEPAIDMIRVSHLKQYFIVAFVGAPFELWDLTTLTLLRTMPKKFPPITALDWSPLHNLKHLKKKEREKQEAAAAATPDSGEAEKDTANTSPSPNAAAAPINNNNSKLVAKEHFVFTDPEGQLYHFSVEGNSIKDGTKIDAEGGLGMVTCIGWKSDHVVRGDAEGSINVWDLKTKSTKTISACRRGTHVKKIRFAPGKGNMKLLVLGHDTVSIWDVKSGDLVNELRSPKDLVSRPVDIDWAASDRPVVATQDGCLRVMSLALNGSSSPIMDYEQCEPIACHSLLPIRARNNFEAMLHPRPWKSPGENDQSPCVEDGFSQSEVDAAKQLIDLMDPEAVKAIRSPDVPTVDKLILASKLSGLKWESSFWEVARASFSSTLEDCLDPRFDLLCDNDSYLNMQSQKLSVHEARCPGFEAPLKKQVLSRMVCLGATEQAVKVLLETSDPGDPAYYENSLRACLVSVNSGADNTNTVKLVATNLIADGKLWEGVELLCMIGKVFDACQYLQSSNEWYASVWLAKCRLKHPDEKDKLMKVIGKYCDHLIANGLRQEAILIQLSFGNYIGVLDMLLAGKMIVLASQFLTLVLDELELIDPNTSHVLVVSEEINLARARHAYFDCGDVAAAYYFCDKADEKGEVLKKEIQMLMADS